MLLFTNDGNLCCAINLPRNLSKRYALTYEATSLSPELTEAQVAALQTPVDLGGDEVCFDTVELRGKTLLPTSARMPVGCTPKARFDAAVTVSSGKNHVVKKLMSRVGVSVKSLHREAVGNIQLGDLPLENVGDWVELPREQVNSLWHAVGGTNVLINLKLAHMRCRYRWALQDPNSTPQEESTRLGTFLGEAGLLCGPCFDGFPGLGCRPNKDGCAPQHAPFF